MIPSCRYVIVSMLVFGFVAVSNALSTSPMFEALADTREANSGIASSFQMAAVLVSLIVLGSAFRNSRRRGKFHSD